MPLRVFPNPWRARDSQGNPCAVVPRDMPAGSSAVAFIGAEIDAENTRLAIDTTTGKPMCGSIGPVINFRREDGSLMPVQDRRQVTRYKWLGLGVTELTPAALFAAGPVTITNDTRDQYYRRLVHTGDLIAADQDTAKRARVPWRDPLAVLSEAAGLPAPKPAPAGAKKGSAQPGGDAA